MIREMIAHRILRHNRGNYYTMDLTDTLVAMKKVIEAADHLDQCVHDFSDTPLKCHEDFQRLHDSIIDLQMVLNE